MVMACDRLTTMDHGTKEALATPLTPTQFESSLIILQAHRPH
jgi:hypothetical protein